MTIRANTMKVTQHALFKMLKKRNFDVMKCEHAPNGIKFNQKPNTNFFALSEFQQGFFEVQDEGSQLAAMRVD